MKLKLPRISPHLPTIITIVIITAVASYAIYNQVKVTNYQDEITSQSDALKSTIAELETLKSQDQVKINQELDAEIKNINETYKTAVSSYEDLLDLRVTSKNTSEMDKLFAETLNQLANKDYNKAKETLTNLNTKITEEKAKLVTATITAAQTSVPPAPQNNAPPGAGYSRQTVSSDAGSFLVDIISADLGSTRVIVDTASPSDCANNCPVLPLSDYVNRNGAYAGVNGSYFCPLDYPSCAGKTNTFDTLLMNKNKTYFNSDNNVYSNNPAVIFGGSYIRFVGAASQWGRDTSIDSMISNYPLLVSGGGVVFGGDSDPKKGSRGNRSFVANRGNTVYIGVVHGATVAESALVMKALGMENALNLDDGGSTALWSGGYKVGPGRSLPNVILFIRK